MDRPRDNLEDGSLAAILRRELAGLERAFDEDVVALLERRGNVREVAIEPQAVPVRVFLGLVVAIRVAVALSHPHICDRRARRQIPNAGLSAEIPCQLDTIFLHIYLDRKSVV